VRITHLSYDGTHVHVSIGAPAGNKDTKFGYAYFLLLARRLPAFLHKLSEINPIKALHDEDTQGAVGTVTASPAAPAPVPDEKQITLDEVIRERERKSAMTVTQTFAPGLDPDKVAVILAKTLNEIAAESTAPAPEKVAEAPPVLRAGFVTDADLVVSPDAAAAVESLSDFNEPADNAAQKVWKDFVLDAGVLLTTDDRAVVLPKAAEIWKQHKDAIKVHGKEFNGQASDHLTRIVAETLGLEPAEAHTLIKAQLSGAPAKLPPGHMARRVDLAPTTSAYKVEVADPAPAPVEVVAPVDPQIAAFLGKLGARTQTPALKDILQVACEVAVEDLSGKRVVRRTTLTGLFEKLKGCHPLLSADNWPNIEKALNGAQMPIFAALAPTKARWDSTT